jgi:hypothetical protein
MPNEIPLCPDPTKCVGDRDCNNKISLAYFEKGSKCFKFVCPSHASLVNNGLQVLEYDTVEVYFSKRKRKMYEHLREFIK